jgi:hypothetical protein
MTTCRNFKVRISAAAALASGRRAAYGDSFARSVNDVLRAVLKHADDDDADDDDDTAPRTADTLMFRRKLREQLDETLLHLIATVATFDVNAIEQTGVLVLVCLSMHRV